MGCGERMLPSGCRLQSALVAGITGRRAAAARSVRCIYPAMAGGGTTTTTTTTTAAAAGVDSGPNFSLVGRPYRVHGPLRLRGRRVVNTVGGGPAAVALPWRRLVATQLVGAAAEV